VRRNTTNRRRKNEKTGEMANVASANLEGAQIENEGRREDRRLLLNL